MSMDDWLEEQIMDRFPDDVPDIGAGRLRVRIFKLCHDLLAKALPSKLPNRSARSRRCAIALRRSLAILAISGRDSGRARMNSGVTTVIRP